MVPGPLRSFFGWAGNLLYPEDCRVCSTPLLTLTRIPVCAKCLADSRPFDAEFFCVQCRTPFLSAAPLDETGLLFALPIGRARFRCSLQ